MQNEDFVMQPKFLTELNSKKSHNDDIKHKKKLISGITKIKHPEINKNQKNTYSEILNKFQKTSSLNKKYKKVKTIINQDFEKIFENLKNNITRGSLKKKENISEKNEKENINLNDKNYLYKTLCFFKKKNFLAADNNLNPYMIKNDKNLCFQKQNVLDIKLRDFLKITHNH
jgi:hypothetical protein